MTIDVFVVLVLAQRKLLAKFKLVPLADDEREPPLHTALDPRSVFTVADHESSPGTLTTWGFMQHVDLGQGLANVSDRIVHTDYRKH